VATFTIRSPAAALVMVAIVYAIAQVVFASPTELLGWDETIYLSQVSPHVPTEYFSAPRSRGITLLPAPLAALTTSVPALRLYMTALSATGLVVAFWPWLTLLRRQVVALAALVFASLWVVQFYGNAVMPNLYLAYGAVATTGWFLRSLRDEGQGPLAALGASLAFMTVMRPPDAAFLVLVLAVATMATADPAAFLRLVPTRTAGSRRWWVLAMVMAGFLFGLIPWLAEGYARFGGPWARLRAASATEGHMRWHVAIGMQLRSLNGPTLCRPCAVEWHHPALSLWWLALPLLVGGGLVVAREARRVLALVVVSGAALAVPYLFLIEYAAPRFLIPTYALWAPAVAALIDRLVAGARGRARPWVVLLAGLILAAQFATQNVVLRHRVADQTRARDAIQRLAWHLNRLGVRPPCVLAGYRNPYVAYYTGCASAEVSADDPATTPQVILAAARSAASFAVLTREEPRPRYLRGWRRLGYTASDRRRWVIYLPPVVSPRP
jgi:hypothetical protein